MDVYVTERLRFSTLYIHCTGHFRHLVTGGVQCITHVPSRRKDISVDETKPEHHLHHDVGECIPSAIHLSQVQVVGGGGGVAAKIISPVHSNSKRHCVHDDCRGVQDLEIEKIQI